MLVKAISRRAVLGSAGAGAVTLAVTPTISLARQGAGGGGIAEYRVDAIVSAAMAERKIPGVILVILHKGRTLLRKGYGQSHLELSVPAQPEHLYGSGSTGKMFTATAIMQLVEAGKLRLEDPVSKHLPEAPPSWGDITIDHLMRHRSGLKDYDGVDDFHIALEWPEAAFIKTTGEWQFEFPAGTKFSYSNTGYVLLGFIVGRVSGLAFQDYMKRHVFEAAGMKTAQVDDTDAILPGRAQGYSIDDAKNPVRPPPVSRSVNRFGDGSLLFNADDLAAWDKAVGEHILISAKSQAIIETATPLKNGFLPIENYGAGWTTRIVRGHRLVSHSGVWNGFGTWIGRWPDDGLAIMVCTNLERGYPVGWAPDIAALIDPALAPYKPIGDSDPARTRRDLVKLKFHLGGGYRTDGSTAQQQVHAAEFGPLAADVEFRLVAIEGKERVYTIGKDGFPDWIVRIDACGRIGLSAA